MESKNFITDRLDHLDAERFRDMVASPPFAILTKRIEAELERQKVVCITSDVTKELRRSQGAAAALRVVLGLPAVILREIEGQKK